MIRNEYVYLYNGRAYERSKLDNVLIEARMDIERDFSDKTIEFDEEGFLLWHAVKIKRNNYSIFDKIYRFVTMKAKKEKKIMRAAAQYQTDLKFETRKKKIYLKIDYYEKCKSK